VPGASMRTPRYFAAAVACCCFTVPLMMAREQALLQALILLARSYACRHAMRLLAIRALTRYIARCRLRARAAARASR